MAEQIRLIQEQQKTTSILDKWSHLLYEGENEYKVSSENHIAPQEIRIVSKGGSNSHFSILQQNHQQNMQSGSSSPHSKVFQRGPMNTSNSNQRFLAQMLDAAQPSLVSRSNAQLQSDLISESNGHFQTNIQSRTLSEVKLQESQTEYETQLREFTQLRAIEEARQLAHAISSTNSHFQNKFNSQEHVTEPDQQSVYHPSVDQQSLYEQSGLNEDYQTIKNYDELNYPANITENNIHEESLGQEIVLNPKASNNSFKNSKTKINSEPLNSYLPHILSSHINTINIEDYNTPQFKSMLDQLLKPIILTPENLNYQADWPSQDKIGNYESRFKVFNKSSVYRN